MMMMISSNRRKKGSAARIVMVGLFLLLLVGIGLFREEVTGFFWRVLEPVVALPALIHRSGAQELQSEVAKLRAQVADRNLLHAENSELKQRLGRQTATSSILAWVLLRPPGTPYDTLIIDAGEDAGIETGNLVSAGGTVFVGLVDEVYASTARVVLFSAPGTSYQATIVPTDTEAAKIPISVEGQGGGSLRGEIPAGSEVKPGDAVILPGISRDFISTVSYVEAKEGESFKTVYLRLPVNMFELTEVEVVKRLLPTL